MSYGALHARISRAAIASRQAGEAQQIRATYTHVVFYKSAKERCYIGTRAECESFAASCGNCRVAPASKDEVEAEALRVERWRPYGC